MNEKNKIEEPKKFDFTKIDTELIRDNSGKVTGKVETISVIDEDTAFELEAMLGGDNRDKSGIQRKINELRCYFELEDRHMVLKKVKLLDPNGEVLQYQNLEKLPPLTMRHMEELFTRFQGKVMLNIRDADKEKKRQLEAKRFEIN
ncbi:MAG: hypothetical protein A2750_03040 [Candidatus Yanofskybacteria bacterium RIFCSPHIGHO2_01_FULL_45_42]|uniref:Uncharacterized protein n=3 Tax=Candidatus Yanofskyibacteriota TaxID=1752733 RepID=A0A1F8H326_9BACT|nr:MAG: hypothetical protein A2750_03040 [Candidatus Yanofskybacteria bacterium RIFCSPHIGHO2_01_FULL_45_42]OGN16432.1 MAG: hypothetical protein A3C81_00490 [Candidatus Yanofskybacteria bacterium RIFCSPHIGHO2_02_FULL_46_19]OGN27379.1 MAG: hypothetical protein A3B17_00240 [Candidatus Yanofskybacteria bacterium RIFCSPLOWO2_01_FULL_45_72]OGN31700.1 MAG: hypothetical protein A3J01_02265 [Candidatus Yanofskybacteria bacterium RIFCSPLOWO2_02_FULL_45_18]